MAIIKETTQVFFGGINITLIKGNEVQDSSPLVKAKPELFEESEPKKAVKKSEKAVKKVETKEEPKEELLVEEPVTALEVTEETEVKEVTEEVVEETKVKEVTEEVVEETKPKRRKRK